MKKIILCIFAVLLFASCVSTNQEDAKIEKPYLQATKIDDYTIEITGTENIKHVHFYITRGSYSDSVIKETSSNISFLINNKKYYLKLYDISKYNIKLEHGYGHGCVYDFVISDENRNELEIFATDKIILQSKRAFLYFEAVVNTEIKFGDDEYGRKKAPYNCLIYLDRLYLAKETKEEKEEKLKKIDLSRKSDLSKKIICKKYGFKNEKDYVKWSNRCSWGNLYNSLSRGSYSNAIPFVEKDIIFVKQNLLTIEDITYTNSQGNIIYIYLVTAGKNQISKCCMIISGHQLNYLDYYGAMITEPLLLEFEGKSEYQQDYRSQSCDVFMVIEENSKEYNEYLSKIKDMMEIEKNPYAYSDILK